MEIRIEVLTERDLPAMKGLLAMFGEVFEEPETYQGAVPSDGYLERLLAKDTFVAIAAKDGEEVVGGLAAYVLEKFERERSEVYLYDLAVLASYRRRGVARRLVEALRDVARERGAYVIFVQADPPDLPAIRLYESLGTKEEVLHFDIDVEPPATRPRASR